MNAKKWRDDGEWVIVKTFLVCCGICVLLSVFYGIYELHSFTAQAKKDPTQHTCGNWVIGLFGLPCVGWFLGSILACLVLAFRPAFVAWRKRNPSEPGDQ
jgi:hypothetical protein